MTSNAPLEHPFTDIIVVLSPTTNPFQVLQNMSPGEAEESAMVVSPTKPTIRQPSPPLPLESVIEKLKEKPALPLFVSRAPISTDVCIV